MYHGRNVGHFKFMKRAWIYQASNNTFDPKTCEGRSYEHWLYVRRIKGRVVFNNHNYSITTCKHQHQMRSLLQELGIKVSLVIHTREGLDRFETAALPSLYREYFAEEILVKKGRGSAKDLKEIQKKIKLARSLGAKMSREKIRELKASMLEAENARLAENRAKRAAMRGIEKQKRALAPEAIGFNPNAFQE